MDKTTSSAPPRPVPVIRPAKPEDATQISDVGRQAFLNAFAHSCSELDMSNFLDSHYTPSHILKEITSTPHRQYIVAEIGSSIVGFASLDSESDEECLKGYPNRIELNRIYVRDDFHGAGIGRVLMESILQKARDLGKTYIWLGVWEYNYKARKFYDKYGFEKVGEHIFTVGTDEQKDWVTVKKL